MTRTSDKVDFTRVCDIFYYYNTIQRVCQSISGRRSYKIQGLDCEVELGLTPFAWIECPDEQILESKKISVDEIINKYSWINK